MARAFFMLQSNSKDSTWKDPNILQERLAAAIRACKALLQVT